MGTMDWVRAFVALSVPQELQQTVAGLQREWRRALPSGTVRWVAPEQVHLTLCFLGNIGAATVPLVIESLRSRLAGCRPFQLELGTVGTFPDHGRPRVLWVGIDGSLTELDDLRRRVVSACESFTRCPAEDPFRPHLTLGRVTNSPLSDRPDFNRQSATSSRHERHSWAVDVVQLIRSELTENGPRHTTLARLSLTSESR